VSADARARVQGIFRDVFDQPSLVVTPELDASMVEEWDSFAQITLIIAIEEEFGIKFALSELEGLKNVGQMLELIDRKTGAA
jgi:acyl carrier protein